MKLLLDMINEWQAKLDKLSTMIKDRKNNLRNAINNPDSELKLKVMNEYGLDMDDNDVKELLTDMYVKNIEKEGLLNKYKNKDNKKVSFGKAHVHEYYDEVYDKVWKNGYKNKNSHIGFIKLFIIMFIL